MKKYLAVALVLWCSPAVAANDIVPANVRDLIDKETALNDKCRGGAGDNPDTFRSCDERDKIVSQLEGLGWCYGTSEQAEFQKAWQQCAREKAPANPQNATKNAQQKIEDALKDPKKVRLMECLGVAVYQNPQPPGHPPSPSECESILREASSPAAASSASTPQDLNKAVGRVQSQASASPALLEFLENLKGPARTVALAHAANMCGFRSDAWLSPFDLEYQVLASSEAKRLHLSSTELTVSDQENTKIYSDTISNTSCRLLINSKTLSDLDSIERKLTGGYR